MGFENQYISVGIAHIEGGLNPCGWRRFPAETGIESYRIPGGGQVAKRAEPDAAIHEARDIDEVLSRD